MNMLPILVLVFACVFYAAAPVSLIQRQEFESAKVRQNIDCASAWRAVEIISLLGQFDEHRFGANEILGQFVERGCDELSYDIMFRRLDGAVAGERQVIGPRLESVVESATTLLEYPAQPIAPKMQLPDPDSVLCDPLDGSFPDDLGLWLYAFALAEPMAPSPLYLAYEERAVFCRSDFWQRAFDLR